MTKSRIIVCLLLSFLNASAQAQHAVEDTMLIYDQAVLQGNILCPSNDHDKIINKQQPFLTQLSMQDTLLWIQVSYDSWHYIYDTITIYQDDGQLDLLWKCSITGAKGDEFWEKTHTLSQEELAKLIEVEDRFRYPKGFSNTKIESCDNCRGTQSVHYLYLKSKVKIFFEPTCNNSYWRLTRESYSR